MYSEHAQYHDALDRFEAQQHAEQFEREQEEKSYAEKYYASCPRCGVGQNPRFSHCLKCGTEMIQPTTEPDDIDLARHAPAEDEETAAAHDALDNRYLAQGG